MVPRVMDLPGKETLTGSEHCLLSLLMGVRQIGSWATVMPVAHSISAAMATLVVLELPRPSDISGLVGTLWRTKWLHWLLG